MAAAVKKKKTSNNSLLLYVALVAVIAYAAYLNLQSNTTTTARRIVHPYAQTLVADNSVNLTPQDLAAHFPRYSQVSKRDPFNPLVGGSNAAANSPFGDASTTANGSWALTGINTVNGIPSALVENATTGESLFLEPGDTWKGLRVLDIATDSVTFVNPLGQQTTLGFVAPSVVAASNAKTSAPLPSLSSISPLPALNGAAPADQGFGRRGRGGGGGYGGGGFGGANTPAAGGAAGGDIGGGGGFFGGFGGAGGQ